MSGMFFDPGSFTDSVSEQIGYKAGLAVSIEAMCDLLVDTQYADLLVSSEDHVIHLRSEEYEDLFYKLLHRLGHTEREFDGDYAGAYLWHKYKEHRDIVKGITELFVEMWPLLMDETDKNGGKYIDPTPFLQQAHVKHDRIGLDIAYERVKAISNAADLSPYSVARRTEWKNLLELESLFKGGDGEPEKGRFIDQRYIDFLANYTISLESMHWRKFEELTAEFFERHGYSVELGPGRNDDGVDVRIWYPNKPASESPTAVIQCKRQKEKVQKVIIKGLFADLKFEGAEYGLIVTSSELSPGSRSTITARGYPIEEANHEMLSKWLRELRTPGTGIVRV